MKHTSGPNDKLMLAQAKAEYNLTAALIRLLPEPEVMSRGRGLRPYKIWRRFQIETMLASPEAQPLIAVRDVKQAAATKANQTKEERRVLKAIEEIQVHYFPIDLIATDVIYGDGSSGKYIREMHFLEPVAGFPIREEHYSEETLKKVLVYVLKYLVDYDHDYFIKGVAKDNPEYFRVYRWSVLDAVSAVYPQLKDVCERRKTGF